MTTTRRSDNSELEQAMTIWRWVRNIAIVVAVACAIIIALEPARADWSIMGQYGECHYNEDSNTRHVYDCAGARIGKRISEHLWLTASYLDEESRTIGPGVNTDARDAIYQAYVDIEDSWVATVGIEARHDVWRLEFAYGASAGVGHDKVTLRVPALGCEDTRAGTEPVVALHGRAGYRITRNLTAGLGLEYMGMREIDTPDTCQGAHVEQTQDQWNPMGFVELRF